MGLATITPQPHANYTVKQSKNVCLGVRYGCNSNAKTVCTRPLLDKAWVQEEASTHSTRVLHMCTKLCVPRII